MPDKHTESKMCQTFYENKYLLACVMGFSFNGKSNHTSHLI